MPSVTMNGITRRPVMSTPLASPHDAAAAIPPSAAMQRVHARSEAARAITTVVSATIEPTDRSMPARHDHHRHAQRGRADDRRLPRDQLEVGAVEEAGANQDAENDRDEQQSEERPGGVQQPAGGHAASSAPVASITDLVLGQLAGRRVPIRGGRAA